MKYRFSKNIMNTPRSFIREILKLTSTPEIISFAGGLPNKELFPVDQIRQAADKVLKDNGKDVLQYTTTEGYLPLREFIADRYRRRGVNATAEEILIVNGSQQALDLLGKIFIDTSDEIIIEKPSYLGAIQAFTPYGARFNPIKLEDDGINIEELNQALKKSNNKLIYTTPSFQNPTGLTYSKDKRQAVADTIEKYNTVLVEDDPYGELRFHGESLPPIAALATKKVINLGTFSKIAVPGLRVGWVYAPLEIMDKLVIAKQSADLHTSNFVQRLLFQYLVDNSIDDHIEIIKHSYSKQCLTMLDAIEKDFPKNIKYTKPEGGMFIWSTLPKGLSAMELFHIAIKNKVAFVPGDPFYTDGTNANTMRLNFTCSDEDTIKIGVSRLAESINEFLEINKLLIKDS